MKHLMQQLKNETRFMPCLFYPAAKELGYSIGDVLVNPEHQAQLLLHIAQQYDTAAVVRMTELWCEAAAYGMEVTFTDTAFPKLGTPVFDDPEEMAAAEPPQVYNDVTRPLIEAVRLAAPQLEKPLIVGVTGPYTLGAVLNGSEEFMMNCMMEPEAIGEFLSRAAGFLTEYILEYKKAGAAAVMIAEPSTAMISPDMMEEFSNSYLEEIIRNTADDDFAVIYHNCGAVTQHLGTIAKLSADAFHFGSEVDLQKALRLIAPEKPVMGNLEPQLFLGRHMPEIERDRAKLLQLHQEHENFIVSTGCDLSPAADIAAVRAAFMPE